MSMGTVAAFLVMGVLVFAGDLVGLGDGLISLVPRGIMVCAVLEVLAWEVWKGRL